MTRSVLRLFAVFAMVAALFVAITPASADVPDVTYVRTIGGPGHAELYAWGMATDIDGNILVGDYNNYVVARYSTTGNLMQTFSGMGDGPGETRQPYGLTVDPNDGSIYVADLNTHEIEKFNANGTFNKTLSYWDWRYAPRVAANSEGNLYVVDSHNVSPDFRDVIHVHDSDGNWLFDFGASGSGPGQLGIIRGIAIGPNDEVYLGDAQQRLIHVFDKNGNFQFAFGGSWLGYDPRGIAVDHDNGWLYIADASEGEVEKYDLAGNHLATFGELGPGPGQLGGAREISIGLDHRVYVADYTNWRVNIYNPNGTYAGEIPNPPQPPPNGGFNQPEGLAVHPTTGDVYVTDTFNHRMQRFTNDGEFVSAWGWRGRDDPYAMDYPRGAHVDPATGNVWMNNTRSGDIKVFSPSGQFLERLGSQGSGQNQFFYARGIHVAADGRVYVPDSGNIRLKVIDKSNNLIWTRPCGTAATDTNNFITEGCTGVTVDDAGNVYAAAVTEHRVYKFSRSGQLLAKWGAPGQLRGPYDVAIYDGQLFVSELQNARISVFDLNGAYQGSFGSRGSGPGQLASPNQLAFDSDGLLYVADKGNERVTVFQVGEGGGPGPDTTPPNATVTVPARNQTFTDTEVEFTGGATDNVGVAEVRIAIRNSDRLWWTGTGWGSWTTHLATLNGAGTPNATWSYEWAAPGDGAYILWVRADDTSGNQDPTKPWVPFNVEVDGGGPGPDTTPPNATVTLPVRNQIYPNGPIVMTGGATDNVAVAQVRVAIRNRSTGLWWTGTGWGSWTTHVATLNGGGTPSATWSYTWTPPGDGGYALWVRADDTSGNIDPTKPWVPFDVN